MFAHAALDMGKALTELVAGALQRRSSVDAVLAGQVHEREEEIAELALHFRFVSGGDGVVELRELFSEGTRPSSEDIARRLGFDPLDTAPLLTELGA